MMDEYIILASRADVTLLEQLFDQIHVCHDHPSAAVAFAAKLVHGVPS